jgi:hypothetical protein
MIVPHDLPASLNHVFMLATPAHVLAKLHWEIYRLKKVMSEKPEHIGHMHEPSYCAFNCAVTVWHLTDWTWKASLPELRARILASLGVTISGHDNKDFVNFQNALGKRAAPFISVGNSRPDQNT